jgi:hypothetical protein
MGLFEKFTTELLQAGWPSTPRAEEELEENERPALGVVAADAHPGVAAHLAREHAVGRDLRERAEDRVGNAEAGEASGGHGRR